MDDATMSLVLTLVLLAIFLNNRMCWEGYQFVDWNFPDAFAVWICPDVFAQLSWTFGFACPSACHYDNKHWHHLLFPLVVIIAGDMRSLQSFGCFLGSFLLLNKHLVNIGERFAWTCFFYLCWFQSPWGLASPTGCNDFALSFGCPVMNSCMFVACLVLLLCFAALLCLYAHYICRLGSECKTPLSVCNIVTSADIGTLYSRWYSWWNIHLCVYILCTMRSRNDDA